MHGLRLSDDAPKYFVNEKRWSIAIRTRSATYQTPKVRQLRRHQFRRPLFEQLLCRRMQNSPENARVLFQHTTLIIPVWWHTATKTATLKHKLEWYNSWAQAKSVNRGLILFGRPNYLTSRTRRVDLTNRRDGCPTSWIACSATNFSFDCHCSEPEAPITGLYRPAWSPKHQEMSST